MGAALDVAVAGQMAARFQRRLEFPIARKDVRDDAEKNAA